MTVGQIDESIRRLRRAYPNKVIVSLKGPGGGYLLTENEDWIADYDHGVLSEIKSRIEVFAANERETIARIRPAEAVALRDTLQRLANEINALIPAGFNSTP